MILSGCFVLLYRTSPARKPYQILIGNLFAHKSGDFVTVSVTDLRLECRSLHTGLVSVSLFVAV